MNAATEWPGTPEERELRRVQKVGGQFVLEFRAGKHPDDTEKNTGWFPLVRDRTRLRDRWIWVGRHLDDKSEELERLRAEIAGTILIDAFASGHESIASVSWFTRAAAQDDYAEGWYFDDECLQLDGWERVTGTTKDEPPRKWTGWRKPQ